MGAKTGAADGRSPGAGTLLVVEIAAVHTERPLAKLRHDRGDLLARGVALRVDSLIRRYRVYHGKGDAPTVIDALEINRDKGTVCKNGRSVEMTKTEFELLQYLIANRGTAVSARKLYEDVWHEKFLPSSANTVMVHILKLRKKLEDDPANPTLIRTVWGKGYQID